MTEEVRAPYPPLMKFWIRHWPCFKCFYKHWGYEAGTIYVYGIMTFFAVTQKLKMGSESITTPTVYRTPNKEAHGVNCLLSLTKSGHYQLTFITTQPWTKHMWMLENAVAKAAKKIQTPGELAATYTHWNVPKSKFEDQIERWDDDLFHVRLLELWKCDNPHKIASNKLPLAVLPNNEKNAEFVTISLCNCSLSNCRTISDINTIIWRIIATAIMLIAETKAWWNTEKHRES